jgi:general secretion pathway protein A
LPGDAAPAEPGPVAAAAIEPEPAAVAVAALAVARPPAPGIDAAFTPAAADEAAAWRALAGLWGTALGPGDPCAVALSKSLQCFRSRGGLAAIRQIDRPGVLRLVDEHGRIAHVLLTAFGNEHATLHLGGAEVAVPLPELARVWRGEFATFWRAPPGYRDGDMAGDATTGGAWLVQRLAAVDGQGALPNGNAALRARVAAFQLAHGLTPDGLAGPLTLMQLGRASGSDEPKLAQR